MAVYLDLVMLLNFLVDLLLLLGTNRLSGYPPGTLRCVLGAALGAVYSGACLLPGFRFLGNRLWRLVSLGLMSAAAYGLDRSALRRGCVFLLLTMALGGIALSFGRGEALPLLCCGTGLWFLSRTGFGGQPVGTTYVPVTIRYGGKRVQVMALHDTGNTLRDPVSGEQVMVLSAEAAEQLTGLTREQLGSPLETLAKRPVPGLRLVPYRAVGSGGMLLAMRFEDVWIGKRRQSAVVAFAADGFGREETYQALTGGAL